MISLSLGLRGLGRGAALVPAVPEAAPALVAAPALTGLVDGKALVGSAVRVDPGAWSGVPAPALQVAWLRDGAPIPGATGLAYTPDAAAEGTLLAAEVTASNARGSARATTTAHPVARPTDQNPPIDSGTKTVTTAFDFTGGGLRLRVGGPGTQIDPVTGVVRITDLALDGVDILVTAIGTSGTTTGRFRLTFGSAAAVAAAPTLVSAPFIEGETGDPDVVGDVLTVDPGTWSGVPAPVLAFQWLREGAAIPGATAASYVVAAADAGRVLSCRVTASNASGSAAAETPGVIVAAVATGPVVTGSLADVVLAQGGTAGHVEAAAAFAGEGLSFAVTGGGAAVDAASGRVTLGTSALRSAETVTVTATAAATGASASTGFEVTVAARVLAPELTATLPAVTLFAGQGKATVSAAAAFTGAGLGYSLASTPLAGITIDAATGLVTVDTDAAATGTATVTVRAENTGGHAETGFALTLRATTTVFDSAAPLTTLGFIGANAAQLSLTQVSDAAGGFARLVTPTSGRVHGQWSLAAGDGVVRALVRWGAPNPTGTPYSPFLIGSRVSVDAGSNWRGLVLEALQPASGSRRLRLLAFTGSGSTTSSLGAVDHTWAWDTWTWVELETVGNRLRARLYPEAGPVPDWQLTGTIPATAPASGGATGPAALPQGGQSPVVDIRRLAFLPAAATPPAAAAAADWRLSQINVQS